MFRSEYTASTEPSEDINVAPGPGITKVLPGLTNHYDDIDCILLGITFNRDFLSQIVWLLTKY